jgi:hypothetical protein
MGVGLEQVRIVLPEVFRIMWRQMAKTTFPGCMYPTIMQ